MITYYLDIQDCVGSPSPFNTYASVDSGNNIGWVFTPYEVVLDYTDVQDCIGDAATSWLCRHSTDSGNNVNLRFDLKSLGIVVMRNVSIQDCVGDVPTLWFATESSVDYGNNTNWTFDSQRNVTYSPSNFLGFF